MESFAELHCAMHLVLPSGRTIPVAARLSYSSHDPYAVHIAFYAYGDAPAVTWAFARDLLAEGMVRPSGHGDVRVWPGRAAQMDVLHLELSSPDGYALLTVSVAVVRQWLGRTYELVPAGLEMSAFDLAVTLSRLLGEVT